MTRRIVASLALLAALGCSVNEYPSAPEERASAAPAVVAPAAEPVLLAKADEAWGTVKGQIVFAGDAPAVAKVNVNKDEKHCLEKGDILSEAWVVNKDNKGVKWTLVWLSGEPKPAPEKPAPLPIHPNLKAVPEKPAELDQPCCVFIPHMLGVRQGQTVLIKNSAPVPHNINVTGNPKVNEGFNVLLPAGGEHKATKLKADRYPLTATCNIHPWMNARIAVFDHPYFAITDADGKFEIKDAPAGEWRLKVWHESIGWRGGADGKDGEKITIKKEGTDLGKLEIKADK